jgi:hypothetical protein
VDIFPWIATVDAFQHWIYSHPGHSRAERQRAWLELMDRFGGDVDWSGHEEARANLWHRQLHIFLHPFYYVEYGIAQLGRVAGLGQFQERQSARALADYHRAWPWAGSRPLPELFEAAGCRFDFSRQTVQPLVWARAPLAAAFVYAFMVPNLFRRLLGEGALTAAFIPIFKAKEKKEGEQNPCGRRPTPSCPG